MTVIEERFEDAGEPGPDGKYDYFYAGTNYRFIFESREFHVRRYDDSPGEAAVSGWATRPGGGPRCFRTIPYEDAEFSRAVVYLRDTLRGRRVTVFTSGGSGGYEVLDYTRLSEPPLT